MAVAIDNGQGGPSASGLLASWRSDAPASAAVPRLHWIDWLRVAAIAGVLIYHTLRPFNAEDWHVKNAETSDAASVPMMVFWSFGLALLFLLAGAGARFALRKRSWHTFLRERTARLLVPLLAGTLLLSPIQGFIEPSHTGSAMTDIANREAEEPEVVADLGERGGQWYVGYFVAGFVLFSDEWFTIAVLRDGWPALAVAVASTILLVATPVARPSPRADTVPARGAGAGHPAAAPTVGAHHARPR